MLLIYSIYIYIYIYIISVSSLKQQGDSCHGISLAIITKSVYDASFSCCFSLLFLSLIVLYSLLPSRLSYRVLFPSTIWHNKVTTTRAQPQREREREREREKDAWRNMAVSMCYIFPSPPTQKPPVPSVPLWGAGESVPVPAATEPSSASWSPGTGRKEGRPS